jgi:CheY-like chemotaxis protein
MSKRILLAEDNFMSTRLAQLGLKMYDLDTAKNGQEAVELFKKNHYDIILMDLQMPVLGGVEATKEIRCIESETGREPRTIIIAVTADIFNSIEEECFAVGFNDFFPKPFSPSTMEAFIEEFFDKHSQETIL